MATRRLQPSRVPSCSRRRFLGASAMTAMGWSVPWGRRVFAAPPDEIPLGERPARAVGVDVLNPAGRVPVSFIIDDSTCLVNLAHYAMPQFAEAWPGRDDYRKDWRSWPREIPDSFVREFGEWCRGEGVKGKYSVVPFPACVGWVDRFLPGWSKGALDESLGLVRDFMAPDWDIHPEMISHTRVLDLRTGRPVAEVSAHTMENSHPQQAVGADYLAEYISRALEVLKNVGLPCEGFTTPGGFGNRVKSELSSGGAEALRAVFGVEVPHYFKYLEAGSGSTAPRVEHASGLGGGDPRCMVNVIAGTGDWFGGWDGVSAGAEGESTDRFINADGSAGRMVEMIEKGEPAIMLCHWPGIYCNGEATGFRIFQEAVRRTNGIYGDRIRWMKLSAIARYWAAKELTAIAAEGGGLTLDAPFAAPEFTLRFSPGTPGVPAVMRREGSDPEVLAEVAGVGSLRAGTFVRHGDGRATLCFDLPRGRTQVVA